MATLSAQIQDLVGSFSDETAMDQWLEDGVRELVNVFPENLKEMCYTKSTFTSAAAGSEAETIASQHLGSIYAGSVACRKINASDKYNASDSDRVDYATSTDPVYYVEGSKLNILPASLSGAYYIVGTPSIDASADSSISSFPDEAEPLVVLYAAIKALQQQMNTKQGDLPSDIVVPVLETITESLPTWSAPSDFSAPTAPVIPAISAIAYTDATNSDASVTAVASATASAPSIIDVSSNAPSYTKPTLTSRVALSSYTSGLSETDPGILSVTSVTPAIPKLTSITFSSVDSDVDASLPTYTTSTVSAGGVFGASTAPTYTKPTITSRVAFDSYWTLADFGDSDPGTLSITAVAPVSPSISTVAYSDATNADASAQAITTATASEMGTIDVSGSAPGYTKPTITSRVAFSSYTSGLTETDPGVFSLSAVAPVPPLKPTISYSSASVGDAVSTAQDAISVAQDAITAGPSDASGTSDTDAPSAAAGISDSDAPTNATADSSSAYTAPSVTGNAGLTGMEAGTIADATDQIEFDTWWDILGDLIETQEDTELAQAQLGKITAYINAFQAEVQDASAAMQATISDAQLATQASIANAANDVSTNIASISSQTQASIANAANDVSTNNASMSTLVQASIANASNDVNASISKMQQSTSAATQKMQQSTSAAIQKMQLSTNVNVQNAAKTLEASIQDYSQEISLFQSEISVYQANINKEVQEYQQQLQHYSTELSTAFQAWSKTESDTLAQYSTDIQNELNEFNKENVAFQMDFQEAVTKENHDLQIAITNANNLAQEYRQEAQQTTSIDQFNKQQDQALNLTNAAKTMEKLIQDNNNKLQKFTNEISVYQADVGKQVQEYGQRLSRYTTELNTVYTAWAKTESDSLQQYSTDIQNELNEYNKENASFQGNIQEAMQEIQVANQVNIAKAQGELQLNIDNENRSQQRAFQNAVNDMKLIFDNNSQTIQKYQAESSVYQSDVNKEIQEYGQKLQHYSTELNTAYQAWAKTESDSLSQYSTDIQNELNEYNKDNTRYQIEFQEAVDKNNADLQIAIANANNLAQEYRQEAQQSTEMDKFNKGQDQALNLANAAKAMEKLVQDNSNKLQKYQTEIGGYSAELNANIQTFTNALAKNRAAFDTSLQKYTSEVQKVSAANQSKIQIYTGEVSNFTQIVQRNSVDYQWLQSQHAQLKVDYQQGLQFLISGGVPPQQQQQQGE